MFCQLFRALYLKTRFSILQNLSSILYKIVLPLDFHIHFFFCPALLCIRESALSQPFMTFENSKLWECMLQNPYISHQR